MAEQDEARRPVVYLAGPDVFLPAAEAWAERRKAICRDHGLRGISPFDPPPQTPPGWAGLDAWRRIFLANEAHIRGADAVIANVTPFRGPSADAGTVYEIGLARGLGKKVFAYSTTLAGFAARSRLGWGPAARDAAGHWRDRDGMAVEEFGLFDNLMIAGGLSAELVAAEIDEGARWTDLGAFTRCVAAAARVLDVGMLGQEVGR